MNNESWFEKRIMWEISLIVIFIGASYFIWSQMASLDKQVALQNQKLDTLIAWSGKHDTETSVWKQELNQAFAYIYEKLGSKYIPK